MTAAMNAPPENCPDLIPPLGEIERLVQLIRNHPEYGSVARIREAYSSLGLQVFPDPFAGDVSEQVTKALQTSTPFSVVRLGDGEMNILSFGAYPDTPNLDRFSFSATIRKHGSVRADEAWMLVLREMMMSAVLQADIVGVLGLWRPGAFDVEKWVEQLKRNPRGYSGAWRGMDYMLRLAGEGTLRNTIVASAHLYFGVLNHLEAILTNAEQIVLITNRATVVEALKKRFPGRRFDHIAVNEEGGAKALLSSPYFLREVAAKLPHDLRGCCCLVGAGPWAEIYCTWIKQRGGVGIDIGSAFDLLNGIISRPVHRRLGLDKTNRYAL